MSESEGDYATELNMFDNVSVERTLKKGGQPDAATPGLSKLASFLVSIQRRESIMALTVFSLFKA
jgi:hypothetical protein